MILKKMFMMLAVFCGTMPLTANVTTIERTIVRMPSETAVNDAVKTLFAFCAAEECLVRLNTQDILESVDACECKLCALKVSLEEEVLTDLPALRFAFEAMSGASREGEIVTLLKNLRDFEKVLVGIQCEAKSLDAAAVLEKPLEVILEYCSQYICLLEELIGE